jgi:hypothetical protein
VQHIHFLYILFPFIFLFLSVAAQLQILSFFIFCFPRPIKQSKPPNGGLLSFPINFNSLALLSVNGNDD